MNLRYRKKLKKKNRLICMIILQNQGYESNSSGSTLT